jgi:hypothetical protein
LSRISIFGSCITRDVFRLFCEGDAREQPPRHTTLVAG